MQEHPDTKTTTIEDHTFNWIDGNKRKLKFGEQIIKNESYYIQKHILCDRDVMNNLDDLKMIEPMHKLNFTNLMSFVGKRKNILIYPVLAALLMSYALVYVHALLFPDEEYDTQELFLQLFYICNISCFVVFYLLDIFNVFDKTFLGNITIGDGCFIIFVLSFFTFFVVGITQFSLNR